MPRPCRRSLVALVALGGAVALAGCVGPASAGHVPGPSGATPVAASTSSAALTDADTAAAATALQTMLDRRAAAVRTRDAAAFTADVLPSATSERSLAAASFRGLTQVPFATFRYTVLRGSAFDLAEVSRRWNGQALVLPVRSITQIDGTDRHPFASAAAYTVVRQGGRWWIAGTHDADSQLPVGGNAAPWDIGEAFVVRGRHSLVVGNAADRGTLPAVAARVDRAVGTVARLFPGSTSSRTWPARVVVYASSDVKSLAAFERGAPAEQATLAAITVPIGTDFAWFTAPTAPVQLAGTRVVLNPKVEGADADDVLVHELTHAATMPRNRGGAPVWFVEGLAEYVAYRNPSDPIARGVDHASATALNGSRLRLDLPLDATFYTGDAASATHYTTGWLVCAYVADHFGEKKLLALTDALYGIDDPLTTVTEQPAAIRRVLGVSQERLLADTAAWAQHLWDG